MKPFQHLAIDNLSQPQLENFFKQNPNYEVQSCSVNMNSIQLQNAIKALGYIKISKSLNLENFQGNMYRKNKEYDHFFDTILQFQHLKFIRIKSKNQQLLTMSDCQMLSELIKAQKGLKTFILDFGMQMKPDFQMFSQFLQDLCNKKGLTNLSLTLEQLQLQSDKQLQLLQPLLSNLGKSLNQSLQSLILNFGGINFQEQQFQIFSNEISTLTILENLELGFSNCNLTDANFGFVMVNIAKLKKLNSLYLKLNKNKFKSTDFFFELVQMKELTIIQINISKNSCNLEGLIKYFSSISHNQKLLNFSLSLESNSTNQHYQQYINQFKELIFQFKNFPYSLTGLSINVSNNKFSSTIINKLTKSIQQLNQLQSLQLKLNKNMVIIDGLTSKLKYFQKLTSLSIHAQESNIDIDCVSDGVSSLPQLITLDLDVSKQVISQNKILFLLNIIQNLTCLKNLFLNLHDIKLKSGGIIKITDRFSQNNSIEMLHLDLSYNILDDTSANAIKNFFEMKNLHTLLLNLKQNNFSQQGLNQIKAQIQDKYKKFNQLQLEFEPQKQFQKNQKNQIVPLLINKKSETVDYENQQQNNIVQQKSNSLLNTQLKQQQRKFQLKETTQKKQLQNYVNFAQKEISASSFLSHHVSFTMAESSIIEFLNVKSNQTKSNVYFRFTLLLQQFNFIPLWQLTQLRIENINILQLNLKSQLLQVLENTSYLQKLELIQLNLGCNNIKEVLQCCFLNSSQIKQFDFSLNALSYKQDAIPLIKFFEENNNKYKQDINYSLYLNNLENQDTIEDIKQFLAQISQPQHSFKTFKYLELKILNKEFKEIEFKKFILGWHYQFHFQNIEEINIQIKVPQFYSETALKFSTYLNVQLGNKPEKLQLYDNQPPNIFRKSIATILSRMRFNFFVFQLLKYMTCFYCIFLDRLFLKKSEEFSFTIGLFQLEKFLAKYQKKLIIYYLINYFLYFGLCFSLPFIFTNQCGKGSNSAAFIIYSLYSLQVLFFESYILYKINIFFDLQRGGKLNCQDFRKIFINFKTLYSLFQSQSLKLDLFTDIIFISICFQCENLIYLGKLSIIVIIINMLIIQKEGLSFLYSLIHIKRDQKEQVLYHINLITKYSNILDFESIGGKLNQFAPESVATFFKWRIPIDVYTALNRFLTEDFPQALIQISYILKTSQNEANNVILFSIAASIYAAFTALTSALKSRSKQVNQQIIDKIVKNNIKNNLKIEDMQKFSFIEIQTQGAISSSRSDDAFQLLCKEQSTRQKQKQKSLQKQ